MIEDYSTMEKAQEDQAGAQNPPAVLDPRAKPPSVASESGAAWAVVQFKRGRLRKYQCPEAISLRKDAYVVVEDDGGEACGLVVHVSTAQSAECEGTSLVYNLAKIHGTGHVVRAASDAEVETLHKEITSDEANALNECRRLVEDGRFDLQVIDCEWRFDRKKITFFFQSDHPVHFRSLRQKLSSHFGVHIWMEKINAAVKKGAPPPTSLGCLERTSASHPMAGRPPAYADSRSGVPRPTAPAGSQMPIQWSVANQPAPAVVQVPVPGGSLPQSPVPVMEKLAEVIQVAGKGPFVDVALTASKTLRGLAAQVLSRFPPSSQPRKLVPANSTPPLPPPPPPPGEPRALADSTARNGSKRKRCN